MKTRTRAALALAAALLTVTLSATLTQAQAPAMHGAKTLTARAKKVSASRGEAGSSPEIKTPRAKNVPGRQTPAPASKGGAKARGGYYYTAHVDNHTGFYVDCYINGNYVGTVAPYGDLYPSVTAGYYHYYCEADFSDGSSLNWTSQTVSGNSVFRISP